uniref:Wsv045-like protein n=1 Tax=Chionoecetes opilio bacilliform virus TaxID=1825681 RepID=A0A1Q3DL26_9VIRU|nr:wsv045-like protein [Chionoecetes opilio bacilliform virus]GAV93162.1 hypothetical protein SCV_038 [Chionoecetes opilio bacilliform virus]
MPTRIEHFTNIVCNYVHAIGDTWAHLIKQTSLRRNKTTGEKYKNKKLAEKITTEIWDMHIAICNPMLSLSDTISLSEDGKSVNVDFNVEVEDTYGVTQTAILMLALDSFVSLVASSPFISMSSNKKDSKFLLKVPVNVNCEDLLNNKGFPVGLCGPFKRWSLNFKAGNLVGKGGVAGMSGIVLSDTDSSFDNTGTDVIERMNSVTLASQQLDDSEMGRTLNMNRRTETGCRFNVSSTKQTNQKDLMHHQSLVLKAIAEDEKDLQQTVDIEDDEIATQNTKNHRKRSRRKGECSTNPLTFVEKFVGMGKKRVPGGSSGRQQKQQSQPSLAHPPSPIFASLFLSGSKSDACYQTCHSLRGVSRIKSLLGKYASCQHNGRNCGDEDTKPLFRVTKEGWKWTLPEDRRIVLVFPDGFERTVSFSITCRKSWMFKAVCTVAFSAKHWLRISADLIAPLAFLPVPDSNKTQRVIIAAFAYVYRLRQVIGFRIPDHSKAYLPGPWNIPLSSMGVTSDRYDRIIEVVDMLMAGGAFVSSCLNNAFFYERNVRPMLRRVGRNRESWLHIDALELSTKVLEHIHRNKTTQNSLSTATGNTNTITEIIQDFSDVSSSMRKKDTQKCLSADGKKAIDTMIHKSGALKALVDFTVASEITGRQDTTMMVTVAPTAPGACARPENVVNSVSRKRKRGLTKRDTTSRRDGSLFLSSDLSDEETDYYYNSKRKSAAITALVLTHQSLDSAVNKGFMNR